MRITIPRQPYHDVMQVCLNGHLITDSYNHSPDFRKKYCTSCGAETIHQCPYCEQNIKGRYVAPNISDLTIGSTPVPKICEYCGKIFPWGNRVESNGSNNSIHELSVELPKIDAKKKKDWFVRIAKAYTESVIEELLNEPVINNQQKVLAQIINLSARLNLIQEARNKGIEDFEKVSKHLNQINDALVKIIHELK